MRRRRDFLPFHTPSITEAEIAEVVAALREGWISTGPRVPRFEREFATAVGAPHALALNSGTAALHLALEAVGVGAGDEVIVPAMTFAATAEVVIHLGARPVFADCRPDTLLADPAAVEAAVTEKTKAIIPVHHSGQACEMDPILELARERGLRVIEDAAHAFPASYRGRPVGSLGDAAAFSFYATKTLAVGEGGMLTAADEALARRARIMSLHGISRGGQFRYRKEGTWRYEIEAPGYKYNMAEPQAAIGLVQLARAGEMLARRREIARRYIEGFSDTDQLETPVVLPEREHAWHLFVVRLRTEALPIGRDRFIEELRARNIGASVHFIPLHRMPYYANTFGLRAEMFPNAEAAYHRIVSLPIWPGMSDADADDVIAAVHDVLASAS